MFFKTSYPTNGSGISQKTNFKSIAYFRPWDDISDLTELVILTRKGDEQRAKVTFEAALSDPSEKVRERPHLHARVRYSELAVPTPWIDPIFHPEAHSTDTADCTSTHGD